MNISVFIIECIIMAVLFGILVFGMLFTIQAAVLEHKEPFRGARVIGWILLIIAVLTFPRRGT